MEVWTYLKKQSLVNRLYHQLKTYKSLERLQKPSFSFKLCHDRIEYRRPQKTNGGTPKHLLWSLSFLKQYSAESPNIIGGQYSIPTKRTSVSGPGYLLSCSQI